MPKPVIHTIGHSNLAANDFLRLLQLYGVDCVVDVRSTPASQYNPQPRVLFRLGDVTYDLPMTDVNFFDQMQTGMEDLKTATAYITVSLGMPFEGKHYKLAAGMIFCT